MSIRTKDRTTPALRVTRVDSVHSVRVWCPYCRREHTHGNAGGYRMAHCSGEGCRFQAYMLVIPRALFKGLSQPLQDAWAGWVVS